jgi:hypothetical protein
MNLTRTIAAAALAVALGLTGCAADDTAVGPATTNEVASPATPAPTEPPSTTAAPTTTAPAPPPTLPPTTLPPVPPSTTPPSMLDLRVAQIEAMTGCADLQGAFDAAYEGHERRSGMIPGEAWLKIMDVAYDRMEELHCFG